MHFTGPVRVALLNAFAFLLVGTLYVYVSRYFPAELSGSGVKGLVFVLLGATTLFLIVRSIAKMEAAHCNAILNTFPLGMYKVDKDGKVLDWNPAMERITGWSAREVQGMRLPVMPPGEEEKFAEFQRKVREEGSASDVDLLFQRKDGTTFPARIYASDVPEIGKSGVMFSVVRDMTSHRRAVNERERLFQAIEQAAESIMITDVRGNIEYINAAFETTSGYSREELLGNNPRILKSEHHDDDFYREMWTTISAGKRWQGRMINTRKDGSLYTELVSVRPIYEAGEITSFVAVKRDVTHELELQRQLDHAQKMETVGRLAGGVAHDFNNMLSVILGYVDLGLSRVSPEEPIYEDLHEVQYAAQRSASLTRQLLAFSRQQMIEPKALDLNETLPNVLKMLDRLIGEDIDLVFNSHGKLWRIYFDPAQLDQVLANLTVNARDAIKGQGRVTIELDNCEFLSDDEIDQPGLVPGQYVLLTFSDTGEGMDETIKSRIFDPFFTTKAEGYGTGLGLATVYGIVKQNDGFIYVDSKRGWGTRFRIYLPRYMLVESPDENQQGKVGVSTGDETILLVEDEASLLKLAKRMLERAGYVVLAARSPREATQITREYRDIDLLLTDVVMPEMNGHELYKKLAVIQPDMKVLFTSGYSDNNVAREGLIEEGVAFIQKPYTSDTLTGKVRRVMDESRQAGFVST